MECIVRVDTGNSRTNGTQKSKKKLDTRTGARGFLFLLLSYFFLLLFLGKMDGSNEVNE